jgi:hypothetical protein|tara:strand:+ start:95 stop:388 length:294 start_codon:yes stop_codon:yes gene_type:complete
MLSKQMKKDVDIFATYNSLSKIEAVCRMIKSSEKHLEDLKNYRKVIQESYKSDLLEKKQISSEAERNDDLSYESGYVHKTQNKKHLPLYTLGHSNIK